MNRHALKPIGHELVVEVPRVELLHRRGGFDAAHPLEPTVQRAQRHHGVHQHKHGDHRGQRVAHLPGDEVDDVQQARQDELDPHQTEHAPDAGERRARAPLEEQGHRVRQAEDGGTGVIPGHRAEGELHEHADRGLEHAADHRAHQKDDDRVRAVEPVERRRQQHGAHAVDGRERAEEQAGAVLVDARVDHHHVPDDLQYQTNQAGDHEHPEQVEEVQLDIAVALDVTTEHALLGGGAVLQVAQSALQLALLLERWVHRGGERQQNGQLHGRADELGAHAIEHDVAEQLPQRDDHERVGPDSGVAAPVLKERPAQVDKADGANQGQDGADDAHDYGQRGVVVGKRVFRVGEDGQQDQRVEDGEQRHGHHTDHQTEHAVYLDDQRQSALLLRRGDVGIQAVDGAVDGRGFGFGCHLGRRLAHASPIALVSAKYDSR